MFPNSKMSQLDLKGGAPFKKKNGNSKMSDLS